MEAKQKRPLTLEGRIEIERTITVVMSFYGLSERTKILQVNSKTREGKYKDARQIIWYIVRDWFGNEISLKEIGMYFNIKDHTTVLYGIRKIKGYIEYNKELAKNISNMQKELAKLRYGK